MNALTVEQRREVDAELKAALAALREARTHLSRAERPFCEAFGMEKTGDFFLAYRAGQIDELYMRADSLDSRVRALRRELRREGGLA